MEEGFWPELLVQELRILTRANKFDFSIVEQELNSWWSSPEAGVTAKDRGFDIIPLEVKQQTFQSQLNHAVMHSHVITVMHLIKINQLIIKLKSSHFLMKTTNQIIL